jgi:hypothetical protein
MGRQMSRVPNAPVTAQMNTKAYCNRTVAFISVTAALYPNDAIQMTCIVSRKSVFESNMDAWKTNLKNPGKLGEGKKVDVAAKTKSGSCSPH